MSNFPLAIQDAIKRDMDRQAQVSNDMRQRLLQFLDQTIVQVSDNPIPEQFTDTFHRQVNQFLDGIVKTHGDYVELRQYVLTPTQEEFNGRANAAPK